jgi:hypothetical protein
MMADAAAAAAAPAHISAAYIDDAVSAVEPR